MRRSLRRVVVLDAALDELLRERSALNARPATLAAYRNMVPRFISFVGDREPSRAVYLEWLASLKGAPLFGGAPGRRQGALADSSIVTYARHVRAFLYWYWDRQGKPRQKLALPKADTPDKQPVPEAELRALLASFSAKTNVGLRGAAVLAVLLDTGMREGELCRLRVADVTQTPTGGQFRISSEAKGRRPRVIPFGRATWNRIAHYRAAARPGGEGEGDEHLFLSERNHRADEGRPLTESAVRQLVVRAAEAASISHVTPHRLRHTFATWQDRHGTTTLTLEYVLGHKSSATPTTRKYFHPGDDLVIPSLVDALSRPEPMPRGRAADEAKRQGGTAAKPHPPPEGERCGEGETDNGELPNPPIPFRGRSAGHCGESPSEPPTTYSARLLDLLNTIGSAWKVVGAGFQQQLVCVSYLGDDLLVNLYGLGNDRWHDLNEESMSVTAALALYGAEGWSDQAIPAPVSGAG